MQREGNEAIRDIFERQLLSLLITTQTQYQIAGKTRRNKMKLNARVYFIDQIFFSFTVFAKRLLPSVRVDRRLFP